MNVEQLPFPSLHTCTHWKLVSDFSYWLEQLWYLHISICWGKYHHCKLMW